MVRRKHEQGVTLLEAMVALAVFTIGIGGVMGLQFASVNGTQRSWEASLATNIATSILEELRLKDYSAVNGTSVQYFTKEGVPSSTASYFTATETVTLIINAFYKDIHIVVSWQPGVQLHQIVLDGRIYQR